MNVSFSFDLPEDSEALALIVNAKNAQAALNEASRIMMNYRSGQISSGSAMEEIARCLANTDTNINFEVLDKYKVWS